MRKMAFIVIACVLSSFASAETAETDRLAKITEDYAKCADVLVGNFPSDEDTRNATKVFYLAMIANVRKMISLESQSEKGELRFLVEFMGNDVVVGFLLKGFTEVDENYRKEKQELKEKYQFDWRRVNTELWSKQGCAAIYNSLK